MMTDKDLTDDVLDEIIAGAKTSMEQYLALSLKAERAANRQQSQQQNIPENIPVNTPCKDAPEHIWLQTAGVWPENGEFSELTWCSDNQHHDDTLYVRADVFAGNSPVIPDCSCRTCRPVTFSDSRFVVCPVCGNKRCPHANDHRHACTGSNESLPGIKPAPTLDSVAKNADSLPGNSPVLPDGWVMVPVEPTEHMIVEGFESEPDEFFSDEEVWEAYDAMSGCQQAAHRAKLCWAAMIEAAPKLE